MVDSPSEWSGSHDASTVRSSVDGNSDYQSALDETHATGSEDFPCRAFHPFTFPRDGHEPHDGALGSSEFPAKSVVTEWGGVDVMGPWLRIRENDTLVLGNCTVHWTAECSLHRGEPFPLTRCYCVDKLHKCFHYDVDDAFCLHANCRCSENIDVVAGRIWPVVVMCRWCSPFPVA